MLRIYTAYKSDTDQEGWSFNNGHGSVFFTVNYNVVQWAINKGIAIIG